MVQVRRGAAVSEVRPVTVVVSSPGIFVVGGRGAVVHAEDFRLVTEGAPARPDAFLSIFCTGLGRRATDVQVRIAGLPAVVTYAGIAPGFEGLNQVNVRVPAEVPRGNQPLQILSGDVPSNVVEIVVSGASR